MCPPGLHTTLGIFFRLFTLLEDACHELDVCGFLQGVDGREAYEAYVLSYRRKMELVDKCTAAIFILDQLVTLFTLTTAITSTPSQLAQLGQLQSAIADKQKELQDMVLAIQHSVPMSSIYIHKETEKQQLDSDLAAKKFRKDEGPFVRALDKALQSFRVQRQAYYSGTFIGNHVHSSLKVS